MLQAKKCTPIPHLFVVFTFGFAIESIKEFGGASYTYFVVFMGENAQPHMM
jgi:hypothetical protein